MAQRGNEAAVSLPVSGIFPMQVMSGHILKSGGKGDCRESEFLKCMKCDILDKSKPAVLVLGRAEEGTAGVSVPGETVRRGKG